MKMVALMISAIVGVSFVGVCNVTGNTAPQSGSSEEQKTPHNANAMTHEKNHPYFQLREQQLLTLIENVHKVQIGDSSEKVRALMGEPSSDHVVAAKENSRPLGRMVIYYAKRSEHCALGTPCDEFVKFTFDTGDHLKRIESNIRGLEYLADAWKDNIDSLDVKTPTAGRQDSSARILSRYVRLRLDNADWNTYSSLVTWPDEPGWDCSWVVDSYQIGAAKKATSGFLVPVTYKRLGLFCYDFDFKSSPKIATVYYELVNRDGAWKVNGPTPDYPDIDVHVLLKSLRVSMEHTREPVRRAHFSDTVRQLTGALR